jgi:hypothetical protein
MAVDKVLGFEGIGKTCVTMKVTSGDTLTVGSAVELESDNTVGFGTTGHALFGIVDHVNGNGLVSVQVAGFRENVACNTTTNPVVGGALAVDGAGKVTALSTYSVASSAATIVPVMGIAVSVDATNDVATIKLF